MSLLEYKPQSTEVISRLNKLFTRKATDSIFACFETPNKVLQEFQQNNPEGFCDRPDLAERIVFWDRMLKEWSGREDDFMPSAYLSECDQGLYGGLVGGDLQFMCHDNGWISSMVAPILNDLAEIDTLAFDPENQWYKDYIEQMRLFAQGAKGNFGISHFILIDGLNFAFELVGASQTYMSLIDQPELIRKTIDFAFMINAEVMDAFFREVPLFEGGTFSNMAQWLPGRIVSESLDPFHMTSVEYFEEWGRPNVEKIFARYDGGVVHIHGNGRHLFEAARTLEGLKGIYLGDDTGFPLAFDILPSIRHRTGDVPLVVAVEYEPFIKALDAGTLTGGVMYMVKNTPDTVTANRCMEKVRAFRK